MNENIKQVINQLRLVTQMLKDIQTKIPEDQLYYLYVFTFQLRAEFDKTEALIAEKFKEFINSQDTSAPLKEDLGIIIKAERVSEAT